MLLAIDVGNTNIVIGCMDGEDVLFTERLSTDVGKTSLEYAILIRTALDIHGIQVSMIDGAIIASVVPPVTPIVRSALKKITGIRALVIGPGIRTGLNIHQEDPSSVGADLIAGAVGALHKYKPPVIVIDMGTATTLSVIDQNGVFRGGAIMPGLVLSLHSLVSETSMLQGISLDQPKRVIGNNTEEAMRSGLVYGHAAMVDGMLDRMEEELGKDVTVVAAGNMAAGIVPVCRHSIELDSTLMFTGMQVIYQKNRRS